MKHWFKLTSLFLLLLWGSACKQQQVEAKKKAFKDHSELTIEYILVGGDSFNPKSDDKSRIRCYVVNHSKKNYTFFEDIGQANFLFMGQGENQRIPMNLEFSDDFYEQYDQSEGLHLKPGEKAMVFDATLAELFDPKKESALFHWGSRSKNRPPVSPMLLHNGQSQNAEFWFETTVGNSHARSARIQVVVQKDE